MAENKSVKFVLEMVIGDYMEVLEGSVDEDNDSITMVQYKEFIDGVMEIGRVFDINVCDLGIRRFIIEED